MEQSKLIEIAASQGGFFSASQAVDCGIISTNHTYHVKRGTWERWQRGIYRLAALPLPQNPDLHALALYLRGRDGKLQGVFALETAASFYEFGDFMPSKHYVIVFPGFERTFIPKGLEIVRDKLSDKDWHWFDGLPVTTSMRTIVDLINSGGIETNAAKATFMEARRKGKISSAQVSSLENANPATARLISEWEADYVKIRKS